MLMASFDPLAKIFQPFFYVYKNVKGKLIQNEMITTNDLLKDPSRVYKEEFFSVMIPRSVGMTTFISGRPQQILDLDLAMWLCPSEDRPTNQETDAYGVVDVRLDPEIQAALTYMQAHENDNSMDLKKALADATADGKKRSRERVLKQIRYLHGCLKKQYEQSDELKLGRHDPSPVEYLCTYVLKEEQTKDMESKAAIRAQFKELFDKV